MMMGPSACRIGIAGHPDLLRFCLAFGYPGPGDVVAGHRLSFVLHLVQHLQLLLLHALHISQCMYTYFKANSMSWWESHDIASCGGASVKAGSNY